jgi:L-aminopeptidase/D-esterase-like protein
LFIALSTANPNVTNPDQVMHTVQTIPNDLMDSLFAGVVQATEEAVVNALVDNDSMTGRDNHHVEALPHDRLRELMKRSR